MNPHKKHGRLLLLLLLSIAAAVIVIAAVAFSGKFQKNTVPSEAPGETAPVTEETAEGTTEQSTETASVGTENERVIETESETLPPETETVDPKVKFLDLAKQHLEEMSTEEKVAQLFFVTPELLTGAGQVTTAQDATREALKAYPVGGVVYFDANFIDPAQTKEMLSNTQSFALETQGLPLFLAADEEGGRVRKIGKNPAFQVPEVSAMQEVASGGEEAVYQAADTIGSYLSELGINVDFAPDADVLVNAENTVIGERAFSSDPETVAQCAAAYVEGLHANQVLAAYKHFPGHGGTAEDSHTGKAYLIADEETIRSRELIPFARGADAGVDFIMVSHICLPEILGDETPACLSEKMVSGILRDEFGYDGIIITDSLQMKAISDYYSSGEAAVRAIQAGCDMILMPKDLAEAYQGVLAAVQNGTILEDRIDASVARILYTKYLWMENTSYETTGNKEK